MRGIKKLWQCRLPTPHVHTLFSQCSNEKAARHNILGTRGPDKTQITRQRVTDESTMICFWFCKVLVLAGLGQASPDRKGTKVKNANWRSELCSCIRALVCGHHLRIVVFGSVTKWTHFRSVNKWSSCDVISGFLLHSTFWALLSWCFHPKL